MLRCYWRRHMLPQALLELLLRKLVTNYLWNWLLYAMYMWLIKKISLWHFENSDNEGIQCQGLLTLLGPLCKEALWHYWKGMALCTLPTLVIVASGSFDEVFCSVTWWFNAVVAESLWVEPGQFWRKWFQFIIAAGRIVLASQPQQHYFDCPYQFSSEEAGQSAADAVVIS
jgi:hypothetical protein